MALASGLVTLLQAPGPHVLYSLFKQGENLLEILGKHICKKLDDPSSPRGKGEQSGG